jgi:hypothetical protein
MGSISDSRLSGLGGETQPRDWINSVNIEDIPCTNEAIDRLLFLGREEMPDAAGIVEFDYRLPAPEPEAAKESEKAREESRNAEATPIVQDPHVAPQGDT